MTLLSKTVIAMVAALTSLFILKPPPAPTAQDLAPRHAEIFEGYASPVITTTTLKTALNACERVYEMARYVGWDESQLTTLIAVAQREMLLIKLTQLGSLTALCRSMIFGAYHRATTNRATCKL